MTLFSIIVEENSQKVKDYFEKMQLTLLMDNFGIPLFEAKIKEISKLKVYILNITPRFPNIAYMGLIYIMGYLAFNGLSFNWFLIPGIFLLLCGFVWTKYFYWLFLYKGFNKQIKNNKIKLLSDKEFINMICYLE